MPVPLFLDAFDYATAAILQKWDAAGSGVIAPGAGLDGNNALTGSSTQFWTYITKIVTPQTPAEGICGYATFLTEAYADYGFGFDYSVEFAVFDGTTPQLSFTISDAGAAVPGAVRVARGNYNGTVLGTSTVPVYEVDIFHLVEFAWRISDTNGEIEVRRDGVTVLRVTGVNTRGGSRDVWDRVSFALAPMERVSHLYLMDRRAGNDFVGIWRVLPLNVTGDGISSTWSPSASTNASCVDDASPDADSTYVEATANGQKDFYTHESLGAWTTKSKILAVQTNNYARKISSANPNQLTALAFSRATEVEVETVDLPTGYIDKRTIMAVNPVSAAVWTPTEVNDAQFGIRHTR